VRLQPTSDLPVLTASGDLAPVPGPAVDHAAQTFPIALINTATDYVESEILSSLDLFALVDGDDREQGGGRWDPDLAWGGASRRRDVGEATEETV
jgi:hypothetical protein